CCSVKLNLFRPLWKLPCSLILEILPLTSLGPGLKGEVLMVSNESTILPSSQATRSDVRRLRGLELFCLSFLALFLDLMVIRWAPAVGRLIAYYANLILISSFLGLGVGAIIGNKRKSLFQWLPTLLLINVVWLLIAHFITLPTTASEHRFYTP